MDWLLPEGSTSLVVRVATGKGPELFASSAATSLPALATAFDRDPTASAGSLTSEGIELAIERTQGAPQRHRTRRVSAVLRVKKALPSEAELDIAPDVREAIVATSSLTPQEEVIVIDSWNKVLGWKDLFMDLVYKTLLTQHPDLHTLVEANLRYFPALLFGLFDLAVRSLRPATERVQREAYRGVHSDSDHDQECQTIAEYAAHFAALGFRPRHWLALRPIFLWAFEEMPYMEEYEVSGARWG